MADNNSVVVDNNQEEIVLPYLLVLFNFARQRLNAKRQHLARQWIIVLVDFVHRNDVVHNSALIKIRKTETIKTIHHSTIILVVIFQVSKTENNHLIINIIVLHS